MGIKTTDITPLASYGPSALTPVDKDVVVKVFAINRTDTSASTKCVIPADSTIIDMRVFSPTASDAGTTATISVGVAGGSNTYYLNTVDVKSAAGKIAITSKAANLINLETLPLGPDIQLTGIYAETGTASTTGGPFYVTVEYVR